MNIGLIAYNFNHRKTQDFIFRLLAEGIEIKVILAADKKKLNIPSSTIRKSVRFDGLMHPSEIARQFEIPYEVVDHNTADMVRLVEDYDLDAGVISGARILKPEVIDAFGKGIINFHPGLIPEARGLDAILWSVYHDIPIGVTSHLIDHRVDAGKILEKNLIGLQEGDTLFDVYEKVYSLQLNMIRPSLELLRAGEYKEVEEAGEYRTKMSPELEQQVVDKLPEYLTAQLK